MDRILEELQRGLESPYKREIQRLLGIARLLSEVLFTVTSIFKYIHTYIHTYYFQLENEYRNNFIHTVQVHTSVLKVQLSLFQMYNYAVVSSSLIFDMLYHLINFGHEVVVLPGLEHTYIHAYIHTYIKY